MYVIISLNEVCGDIIYGILFKYFPAFHII